MDVRETQVVNKEYDPTTGAKCINQYSIIREIGRGVFGKVKLARDAVTKEEVAIKIVCKKSKKKLGAINSRIDPQTEKIRREIAILKKCVHPNIVQLKEVIDNPASEKIYLVLEYLKGGEVKWKAGGDHTALTEDTVRLCMRDVLAGVQYLHYQGIIHRDLKPANFLWTDQGRVKISDFGVSVYLGKRHITSSGDAETPLGSTMSFDQSIDDESDGNTIDADKEMNKTAGSPAFFAPEMCDLLDLNECDTPGSAFEMGKAIDIWAIGVSMYCLLFGVTPFSAATEYELFRNICTSKLTIPDCTNFNTPVSKDLSDILTKILDKSPATRISLQEVKQHPWLTQDLSPTLRDAWLEETDPDIQSWYRVEVTEEEISQAINLLTKLRSSLRHFSASVMNFGGFGARLKGASISLDEGRGYSSRHRSVASMSVERKSGFFQGDAVSTGHPVKRVERKVESGHESIGELRRLKIAGSRLSVKEGDTLVHVVVDPERDDRAEVDPVEEERRRMAEWNKEFNE